MIAEVIGALGIAASLTTLAVYAITATRRAGSEQARADVLAVRMEVALAKAKNSAAEATAQKERADALDAALARAAARAVGSVHGAFGELLEEVADLRARSSVPAAGNVVPDARDPGDAPAADHRSDTDLLRPGE